MLIAPREEPKAKARNKKTIWIALAALLVLAAAAFGFSLSRDVKEQSAGSDKEGSDEPSERLSEACGSNATYGRLKEVVFEQAVRIRNADPANLDTLAANSVVRMENPVMKSRDEDLNVTVCTGRFVLELPPGAEAGFGGQRRLVADIEYAAQAAVDGSGLVYQLNGAEPIIYKLAAFDLKGQSYGVPNGTSQTELAMAPDAPATESADADVAEEPAPVDEPAVAAPRRAEAPAPAPVPPPPAPERRTRVAAREVAEPAPRAEPRAEPVRSATAARPSFNCRNARSRSERMVCSSNRLAAKDRAMSSIFYSALADADPRTRAELRRTRDRFLAYRERCGSEACIAEAYDGRVAEIRDIMAGAE